MVSRPPGTALWAAGAGGRRVLCPVGDEIAATADAVGSGGAGELVCPWIRRQEEVDGGDHRAAAGTKRATIQGLPHGDPVT